MDSAQRSRLTLAGATTAGTPLSAGGGPRSTSYTHREVAVLQFQEAITNARACASVMSKFVCRYVYVCVSVTTSVAKHPPSTLHQMRAQQKARVQAVRQYAYQLLATGSLSAFAAAVIAGKDRNVAISSVIRTGYSA